MTANIALAVVALALLAALVLREAAHDRERKRLLDRIQAPEIGRMAAISSALPAFAQRPEPPDDELYTDPIPLEDDLFLTGIGAPENG